MNFIAYCNSDQRLIKLKIFTRVPAYLTALSLQDFTVFYYCLLSKLYISHLFAKSFAFRLKCQANGFQLKNVMCQPTSVAQHRQQNLRLRQFQPRAIKSTTLFLTTQQYLGMVFLCVPSSICKLRSYSILFLYALRSVSFPLTIE